MSDGSGGLFGRVRSVRVRITLAAAVVTAVAVGLAGWLLIRSVENTQLGKIHADAEARAEEVADRLRAGVPPTNAVIGDSANACSSVDLTAQVIVSDEAGTIVASNPDLTTVGGQSLSICKSADGQATAPRGIENGADSSRGSPGTDDPLGPASDAGVGGPTQGAPGAGISFLAKAEKITRTVDVPSGGRLTVTAVAPVDEVSRSVDAVRRSLWVLLPGLVGIVALGAWWLAGRALRPVEAIRVEAEEIGGSTIHRRLPEPHSRDEIARLARTMNDMLTRLEQSALRQRQFVADASHELRSPVAAIRTDLEVALHEGNGADWPTVAQAVLVEESRLDTLLGDLLVLACDDEAATAAHTMTIDMAKLAADEVARPRRVPVTLDVSDLDASFVVAGAAARLERVLSNLVDNAARHAESKVRMGVSSEGGRVRVVVDDDGPGIAPIDRERIFERFTRLDVSRARDRGGAGLGLAVVRSIATRHGGYVWADSSPLGGARFTVELPAAPTDVATFVGA